MKTNLKRGMFGENTNRPFVASTKQIVHIEQEAMGTTLDEVLKDLEEKKIEIDDLDGKVEGTVVEDGGEPSVDVGVVNEKINFAFKNLKGEKGDDGNDGNDGATGPAGPQGPQGDSFQPIEDVSGLVLAHTTGQDNTKAMSQKGVTDAVGEFQVQPLTRLKNSATTTNVIASSSTQHCWWVPVKNGDIIHVTATNGSDKGFRIGFATVKPAIGVALTDNQGVNVAAVVNTTVVSEVNGYVVLNHGSSDYTNQKLEILRYAKAGELNSKASQNSLDDVMQAASLIMGENAITPTSTLENSLFYSGELVDPANSNYIALTFNVQEGKVYRIKGRLPGSSDGYIGYMFVDEYGALLKSGIAGEGPRDFTTQLITCPKGAATLYVSGFDDGTSFKGSLLEIVPPTTEAQKAQARANLGIVDDGNKTIYPKMGYEFIQYSTGKHNVNNSWEFKVVSTMRFVKVNGTFTATIPISGGIRVFKYADDFSYIDYTDYNAVANEAVEINPSNASYVKLEIADNLSSPVGKLPLLRLSLTGYFKDNWDVFNIDQNKVSQSTKYGRQNLIARVWVTDPHACDDDSNDMQDEGEWMTDYGCLQLPDTYRNVGEPTRLIIYCHGAAVNYNEYGAGDTSGNPVVNPRFEPQDLEPLYWLAEGYAIMDVEGNPYDNSNEHIGMPQAMDCYVAAYKWVIEHYNIKRDGVLLGGRSMGGYNTFNLMRRECPIPVIAACPNVPSAEGFGYGNAERKAFCATHMGFDIPDGYVFKDNSNMSAAEIEAEYQLLYDNWDKWVKCVPLYNMCVDLPSKDVMIDMWREGTRTQTLSALHAVAKCPVKLFGCHEDTSCPPEITSALYYRMLTNAGQIAELRLFHTTAVGHEHHYDTQDPNLRTDVTTRYGETLEDIPVVYVEMLRFWRRYEQE